MEVIKVKLIGSSKDYWLTKKQAHELVEKINNKANLVRIGEDMVKASTIKSFETEEVNIADAPTYYIDATKTEGLLPKPKKKTEKVTRRYMTDGTETTKTYRQLEKEHEDFIEKDYEVNSKRLVGEEHEKVWAYEYGEIIEERRFETQLENGVYYTVLTSIVKNGEEKLTD